jgi:hypothetical protein
LELGWLPWDYAFGLRRGLHFFAASRLPDRRSMIGPSADSLRFRRAKGFGKESVKAGKDM